MLNPELCPLSFFLSLSSTQLSSHPEVTRPIPQASYIAGKDLEPAQGSKILYLPHPPTMPILDVCPYETSVLALLAGSAGFAIHGRSDTFLSFVLHALLRCAFSNDHILDIAGVVQRDGRDFSRLYHIITATIRTARR